MEEFLDRVVRVFSVLESVENYLENLYKDSILNNDNRRILGQYEIIRNLKNALMDLVWYPTYVIIGDMSCPEISMRSDIIKRIISLSNQGLDTSYMDPIELKKALIAAIPMPALFDEMETFITYRLAEPLPMINCSKLDPNDEKSLKPLENILEKAQELRELLRKYNAWFVSASKSGVEMPLPRTLPDPLRNMIVTSPYYDDKLKMVLVPKEIIKMVEDYANGYEAELRNLRSYTYGSVLPIYNYYRAHKEHSKGKDDKISIKDSFECLLMYHSDKIGGKLVDDKNDGPFCLFVKLLVNKLVLLLGEKKIKNIVDQKMAEVIEWYKKHNEVLNWLFGVSVDFDSKVPIVDQIAILEKVRMEVGSDISICSIFVSFLKEHAVAADKNQHLVEEVRAINNGINDLYELSINDEQIRTAIRALRSKSITILSAYALTYRKNLMQGIKKDPILEKVNDDDLDNVLQRLYEYWDSIAKIRSSSLNSSSEPMVLTL